MSIIARRLLNLFLVCCILLGPVTATARAAGETVLYSFQGGSDGGNPIGGLISVGDILYGVTNVGGAANKGTVFSITPAGVKKVLHSFKGGRDGDGPASALVNVGGVLYGTTEGGGSAGCGTVFSVTPAGVEKIVYAFKCGADGEDPEGTLINVGGTLYGTTLIGGSDGGGKCVNGCGTVFSLTPSGVKKVLHAFGSGTDGAGPLAPLIYAGGKFYGTTNIGGDADGQGCGTVFSVTPAGVEKVVYAFKCSGDGRYPYAGLVAFGGKFFGTTLGGGGSTCKHGGCGTVFSLTPAGVEKVVYAFGGYPGGRYPYGGLLSVGGKLYGTTREGGYPSSRTGGTVFSVTPAGAMKVLHYFYAPGDGANPQASDLVSVGGKLYGTTLYGGAYGRGTVFEVTP